MPRRKLSDYVCPRCGYATCKSTAMRAHLYQIKTICSPIQNEIELNDFIKERIMNRAPVPINAAQNQVDILIPVQPPIQLPIQPVPNPKNPKKKYADIPGFIYIIQEREHILMEQPIYKIGRSEDIIVRLSTYPKNSDLLYYALVERHGFVETHIIQSLLNDNNVVHKSDIGREYFQSDYQYLEDKIANIVKKYKLTKIR